MVQMISKATPTKTPAKFVDVNGKKVLMKPSVTVAHPERPVIYEKPEVHLCCLDGSRPPITVELMKQILGWETEEEYAIRMVASAPGTKLENYKFSDELLASLGASILLTVNKQKVVCWNNNKNRPFEESTAMEYAQDILERNWAGPTTMPGETVNGETMVISRTGSVHSGQHRGVGLILADYIRKANLDKWIEKWPEPPVLETVLFLGASDNPKVIRTLDNVRPRTNSDVFYTSEIFQHLIPTQKKECSRMLGRAVDMLWRRTGQGERLGSRVYKTNSEDCVFVDNHKTLLKCVHHIFTENKERVLSGLNLSPGQCAAAMYLMASSTSDEGVYRSKEVKSEKDLEFTNYDKAAEFWIFLSKDARGYTDKNGMVAVGPITRALGMLVDEDTLTGGRANEKFCILAKAWDLFRQDQTNITEKDLVLEYKEIDNKKVLIDPPTFGGIDMGPPRVKEREEEVVITETPEEIKAKALAIRKDKQEQIQALLRNREQLKKAEQGVSPVVAEQGSGKNGEPGKPPAPALKPRMMTTRKEVQKANTEAARKADEELAKNKK